MNSDPPSPDSMRCPACRASQEWSDVCRRCKCDLTLLRESANAYWRGRRDVLRHHREGHPLSALRSARLCECARSLRRDRAARGREAHLLSRDWPAVSSAFSSDGPI